jgi:hypothetical protein
MLQKGIQITMLSPGVLGFIEREKSPGVMVFPECDFDSIFLQEILQIRHCLRFPSASEFKDLGMTNFHISFSSVRRTSFSVDRMNPLSRVTSMNRVIFI